MIHKKSLAFYLLVVSIAMAPLLTVDASETGHMANMTENCAGCDMGGGESHGTCDSAQCMLSAGVCATQVGAAYITVFFWSPDPWSPVAENRHALASRFRSRPASPVYRPPIS